MIFATDLDRTLIYAKRFLEDFEGEAVNIEIYKGEAFSFISKKALELLISLHQKAIVIPVTTRNLEQYNRIQIFKEYIQPKYHIVNNGGSIFIEGKEDLRWKHLLEAQLESLTMSYDEALKVFFSCYKGPIQRYKKSDNLIWVVWSERDHIDLEGIQACKKVIYKAGWTIDITEYKIYIYPRCISKWEAVRYIHANYIKDEVLCAGDSLFDKEMVENGNIGVIPRESWLHKNLNEKVKKPNIHITSTTGLLAGEEILSLALKYCKLNQN